jgi:membrane protease YdiL (CAAX protease family)
MRSILSKHPVISYFVLAFVISWGAVLAVILPGPVPAPPDETRRHFPFVYLAMLLGPSLAGLFLTVLTEGRSGLRAFFVKLASWRVSGRWYAVALLAAPIAILVTLQLLAFLSPGFSAVHETGASPIQSTSLTTFLLTGLAIGIGAGLFEEIGWTGFATRKIGDRMSVVSAGLLIGLLWGAWHVLANFWGGSDAVAGTSMGLYVLVALFSFLPPFRVLMTHVYRHTQSLPVAIVMHASLTSAMLLLSPPVAGTRLLQYDLVLGGTLWVIVVLALWVERRIERRSHHRGSLGGLRPGQA